MPIVITCRNGEYCPVVQCDACGSPIVDHHLGVAIYENFGPEGSTVPVFYAHKGTGCHDKLKERLKRPGWAELSQHLLFLCRGVEIDLKRFRELIKQYPE